MRGILHGYAHGAHPSFMMLAIVMAGWVWWLICDQSGVYLRSHDAVAGVFGGWLRGGYAHSLRGFMRKVEGAEVAGWRCGVVVQRAV